MNKLLNITILLITLSFNAKSEVSFVHTDMLGSSSVETNLSGQITTISHYRNYGEEIEQKTDDVGYTGHKYDEDLGLSYMQARYYDPVIGRFYSNDPVDYLAHMQRGNPVHGFNRYTYANNNPYKYVDPDGKFSTSFDVNLRVQESTQGGLADRQSAFNDASSGLTSENLAAVQDTMTVIAVAPLGPISGLAASVGVGAAGLDIALNSENKGEDLAKEALTETASALVGSKVEAVAGAMNKAGDIVDTVVKGSEAAAGKGMEAMVQHKEEHDAQN